MQEEEVNRMSTMDERLSNLEASCASIKTTLEFHGKAHEVLNNNIRDVSSDVKQLLLQRAEKAGEGKATKKIAVLVSGAVSLIVTLAIAYFQS